MICQNCQQSVATVHLTEIEQGKKREVHLCDTCAHKKGMVSPFGLGSLIPDLAGAEEQAAPEDPGRSEDARCPQCGITYREFRSEGRLGCGHDYDGFRDGLVPLLERIHGATQHVGKVPARMGRSMDRERDLIDMRRKLQEAIQTEQYELAAQLRDRIREIEEAAE